MSFISWNDLMSVQVKEIDLQHQQLVKILNDLHDSMQIGRSEDILMKILDELFCYAKQHFATEERYFKQFDYPESEKHIEEHIHFKTIVFEFVNELNTGKIGLSLDILNFLKQWLYTHILETDKKYASFFSEKGLK